MAENEARYHRSLGHLGLVVSQGSLHSSGARDIPLAIFSPLSPGTTLLAAPELIPAHHSLLPNQVLWILQPNPYPHSGICGLLLVIGVGGC